MAEILLNTGLNTFFVKFLTYLNFTIYLFIMYCISLHIFLYILFKKPFLEQCKLCMYMKVRAIAVEKQLVPLSGNL